MLLVKTAIKSVIGEASQMLLISFIDMNILIMLKGSNEAALQTAIALRTTIMNWRVPA